MKYIGENAIKKLISLIKGDLATKQDSIAVTGVLERDTTGVINGVETVGATLVETQEATLVDVPNGLLKGDGTTISAAVAGTDYVNSSQAIRYDAAQTLTDAQKQQARGNIGAEQIGLNALKTIYVSPSGNDNTGDGSQSKPFRQVQKAIDSLPKNLGASKIKISVAAGEYAGFIIAGFYGTGISNNFAILIEGESRGTTIITGGIEVSSCICYICIKKCTVSGTTSNCNVLALNVRGIYVSEVALVGTAAVIGAWFNSCAWASIYYSEISEKSWSGVLADGTTLYCGLVSGTNNAVAIHSGNSSSGYGGIVVGYKCTIDGTTKYRKDCGGIIFMDGALL